MAIVDHRAFAERISKAMNAGDATAVEGMLTEDYVDESPQSGERIRGRANFLPILTNIPPAAGSEDRRADIGIRVGALDGGLSGWKRLPDDVAIRGPFAEPALAEPKVLGGPDEDASYGA